MTKFLFLFLAVKSFWSLLIVPRFESTVKKEKKSDPRVTCTENQLTNLNQITAPADGPNTTILTELYKKTYNHVDEK